jgi:hypothetical protein
LDASREIVPAGTAEKARDQWTRRKLKSIESCSTGLPRGPAAAELSVQDIAVVVSDIIRDYKKEILEHVWRLHELTAIRLNDHASRSG